MADSTGSDPWLPAALERRVMEILKLPEGPSEAALQELFRQHPEHASRIRERLASAEMLHADIDALLGAEEGHPEHVGPYRILEVLGEGGMGTVYLAEQDEPVQRRVALKAIKLGMDTKQVLARFRREQQNLAMMDHPGIAKVFDAGHTERGRPFFTMEHVAGVPVTRFCDDKRYGVRDRLRLLRQVCAAVQHAHQKGVIHRDLKPSNILVTESDRVAAAKIIDFGLARAIDQRRSEHTVFTRHGLVVGTPEYMSPEQAELAGDDIDTRTDVYSLGVVMYELLAGALPFDGQGRREAGLDELRRRIREDEPPRPSTRVTSVDGDTSAEAAQRRRTDVAGLVRALRGDVDWITMKALAKDRDQRYQSASEFGADIDRYLRDEPVLASPPSARYRIAKFVRRYKIQVAAVAAVFFALVVAIVGTGYGLIDANRQRQRADAENSRFRLTRYRVELDDAIAEAGHLVLAWPENASKLERWLRERGEPLAQALDEIRAARDELRDIAGPMTRADHETLRRFREEHIVPRRRQLEALERVAAVRAGTAAVETPQLDEATKEKPLGNLELIAIQRAGASPGLNSWGEEAYGLAVARHLVARAEAEGIADVDRASHVDALAWALFRNGLDEQALSRSAEALMLSGMKPDYAVGQRLLREAITAATGQAGAEERERLKAEIAALEDRAHDERDWQFEDGVQLFLHRTLQGLVRDLERFCDVQRGTLAIVRRRHAWASQIHELSVERHRDAWEQARESIRKSDGVTASTLYASDPPLDLQPQIGLVPLGMNPKTRLWEFYHLRSAWDPHSGQGPEDIEIPAHDPMTGDILVTDDTGIVFVLVPGGTFTMGAQNEDRQAPGFDSNAGPREYPPHKVALSPFLMARHELTQAQWMRLCGDANPSAYDLDFHDPTMRSPAVTLAHPVESVSGPQCEALIREFGLELPTEAQWEYACKAGTETRFYSGPEEADLEGFENLLDRYTKKTMKWASAAVSWEDDFVIHAPVGSFQSNGFGLHDMSGNVYEWCRDLQATYRESVRSGDGLREVDADTASKRIIRGGSYDSSIRRARSAWRNYTPSGTMSPNLGLRAARRLY